jgi:hypothetical protein
MMSHRLEPRSSNKQNGILCHHRSGLDFRGQIAGPTIMISGKSSKLDCSRETRGCPLYEVSSEFRGYLRSVRF